MVKWVVLGGGVLLAGYSVWVWHAQSVATAQKAAGAAPAAKPGSGLTARAVGTEVGTVAGTVVGTYYLGPLGKPIGKIAGVQVGNDFALAAAGAKTTLSGVESIAKGNVGAGAKQVVSGAVHLAAVPITSTVATAKKLLSYL